MKSKHSYNSSLIVQDSEFKYYFLGMIASDGWISKDNSRVELTLKESDKDYLDILRKQISDRPLIYKEKQKAYRLTIEDITIKNELLKYINCYDKTFNLVFPTGIPEQYLKDFMRGYFDGDGTIGVKVSYKKVSGIRKEYPGVRMRLLGTKPFLYSFAQTLKRLGLVNFVREPSKKGKENVFIIEYAFASAERILTWLYKNSNFYLGRKKKVFELIINSDSDFLMKNYSKVEGRYNTQTSNKIDEDIVDISRNTLYK
jgi:hypothetical protein